jgi:hypothetical protein
MADTDIAMEMFYDGPPSEMVAALVSAGLLEANAEHRLIVHDWHIHSDDATDNKLTRGGLLYANGKAPRMRRLSKEERERFASKHHAHAVSTQAHVMHTTKHGEQQHATTNHLQSQSQSQSQSPESRVQRRSPEPVPESSPQKAGREFHDDLPTEAIAHAIMLDLCLSGTLLLRSLTDIVRSERETGRTPTQIRASLTKAWKFYEQNAAKMKWPITPEKYFGGGSWRNLHMLPWKEGQEPKLRPKANGSAPP